MLLRQRPRRRLRWRRRRQRGSGRARPLARRRRRRRREACPGRTRQASAARRGAIFRPPAVVFLPGPVDRSISISGAATAARRGCCRCWCSWCCRRRWEGRCRRCPLRGPTRFMEARWSEIISIVTLWRPSNRGRPYRNFWRESLPYSLRPTAAQTAPASREIDARTPLPIRENLGYAEHQEK